MPSLRMSGDMATRILILTPEGEALAAIDGHHGELHAAQWADTMVARLRSEQGIDAVAVELVPSIGGDDVRRGVVCAIHRVRGELRALPDGRRELIALNLYPEPRGGSAAATVGAGRGLLKAQAAATPRPILGGIRVVHAPPDVANPRAAVRVRDGRLNPPPGEARTHADLRLARRALRAALRGATE